MLFLVVAFKLKIQSFLRFEDSVFEATSFVLLAELHQFLEGVVEVQKI